MALPGLDFSSTQQPQGSATLNFQAPTSSPTPSSGGSLVGPPGPPGSANTGYGVASSGGSTGGTGGSGAAPLPSGQTTNPTGAYQQQGQQSAQQELDARNAQIRSGISSAYQPIFDAFDKQIGMLPDQQNTANQQVGDLATGQQADVKSNQDRQVSDLNSNIDDENNQANMNLNDLGQNIQNVLKGAAFYLGSLGSGDSSAAGDYTTAITNNADRTRGQVLNTRDVAVHQINQKIADVNSLAGQNLNDIDTWKNNQLTTITQEFQKQLSDLTMGKAQAQGQEGKDLVNLQQSALDNYYSRLKQLDDTVYGYNAAIAQWQTERAGWLQDQLTLMHNTGSYSSTTNPQQLALIQSMLQGSNNGIGSTPQTTSSTPGSGATNTTVATPTTNPLQQLVGSIGNLFTGGQ